MTKKIIIGLTIALICFGCNKENDDSIPELSFDEKLSKIKEINVKEISAQNGFNRQFEVLIKQPLDHNNPNGPHFEQTLYLSHISESAPLVLIPSGYSSIPDFKSEVSELLESNQIYISHRFMTDSKPENMDWEYLTVQQAASDINNIVEKFKSIYKNKWISYGSSKGGSTTLFHKRFYPEDVDASIVKVAPISFGIEDSRYEDFIENVGDQAIREKIKRYQIHLLENREGVLPLIDDYIANANLTYSMTAGEILEFEALEYPFTFWQYSSCNISLVPDTTLNATELFDLIKNSGYLPYYSDEYRQINEPYYYQIYSELGYYRLNDDQLSNLIIELDNPSYSYFLPKNVQTIFKAEVMIDISNWLKLHGDNIIYIYGENDPWTGGAVELTGQTNAVKIIQSNANHLIKIDELDQKQLVYETLENWLDIEIFSKNEFN